MRDAYAGRLHLRRRGGARGVPRLVRVRPRPSDLQDVAYSCSPRPSSWTSMPWDDLRRVVVVGAGVAGLTAVDTLRRRGFEGSVSVLGTEPHQPYDRPPLSKQVLSAGVGPSKSAPGLDRGGTSPARTRPRRGSRERARPSAVRCPSTPTRAALRRAGGGQRSRPRRLPGSTTTRRRPAAGQHRGPPPTHRRRRTASCVTASPWPAPWCRRRGFLGSEVAAAARHAGLDVRWWTASRPPGARLGSTRS